MKIKKFNEGVIDQPITIVWVIVESWDSDLYVRSTFSSEILAADYLIKYVNEEYEKDFEPFFDEIDGSRFFLDVSENEDYQKCLRYLKDVEAHIILSKSIITTSPKIKNKK